MFVKFHLLIKKTLTRSTEYLNRIRKMSLQSSASKPLAAICHMRSTNDKKDNLKQVCQIVEKAKELNAKFVFLPECCDFVGEHRKQTLELSEPLTGPTMDVYKQLAKNNRMWLSLGGLHESILDETGEKTDKIYNSHILIDECGEIVTVYRKLHLFDVDTADYKFRESEIVCPGKELIMPIETPIGNLGLLICYDVRFSETSTILRKKGAQILTYPSAFAYSTGKAHWEILLRGRAIENQCYVIASAQTGFHNNKRQSYGHAMIIGPWGQILTQCKDLDLDVCVGAIDLSNVDGVRLSMPCFDHRRDDVYSLTPYRITEDLDAKDMNFGEHIIIPADTIFYTSDHCFAFTNIRCVVKGHVLVATKRPAKRLGDLTPQELSDLIQTTVKIQQYIESFYHSSASTINVQDGKEAGQTVFHVHFHVMPRRAGDFNLNDEIYAELHKHDHECEQERRPLAEMIDEAAEYREFIKKNH